MRGLDAALRRLSGLPEALSLAARSAAEAAADQAVHTARQLVPVRTGALRASISAAPHPQGALLRADRPYALPVEIGHGRTAAHPYLVPAARWADYPARAVRAVQEVLR